MEFAVDDMTDVWEWSSNEVESGVLASGANVVGAIAMGDGGCSRGTRGSAANEAGSGNTWEYRCAR